MSTGSTGSQGVNRRIDNLQKGRVSRHASGSTKPNVSRQDAYSYALRVAYLHHMLQPRAKRLQRLSAPKRPQAQRTQSSVTDLVRDFSTFKDPKSVRFPQGFMAELDKRITGVLMGKEKSPEFGDPMVKRTFAVFLNEFKRPEFRKSMEADRKMEGLILIFFSNATKELQKGKAPDDDHWKLLVDRHVALFVRLISATLKTNEWHRDKPELASRLQILESKLLRHDQDLSAERNGGTGGSSVEVEVPRSQAVKDMPQVLTVAHIFRRPINEVQADLDEQKKAWTEKAALQDLKLYQTNLSLNTKKTLRSQDFDTDQAFEAWKKQETPELSQMLLAIVQSNPELARSAPGALPHVKAPNGANQENHALDTGRRISDGDGSLYTVDVPVDMSALNLTDDAHEAEAESEGEPYIFIPPEPRRFYKVLVKEALSYELAESGASSPSGDTAGARLLSKKTSEVLSEVGHRWRLPYISRLMLLLDAARDKYIDQELDLDTLDTVFNYFKDPPPEKKRPDNTQLFDRNKWPISDYILNQQALKSIGDMLHRDFFEQFATCYTSKPPNIGPVMAILESHIYNDVLYSRSAEDLNRFGEELGLMLSERAQDQYDLLRAKEIEPHGSNVDFYHVVQFGRAVLKLIEKIQKRYRKTPEIMGVEPTAILVTTVLPAFENDAHQLLTSMLNKSSGENEIPIEDGFELYKELVEMRRVHVGALPDVPFGFNIEDLLAPFVWRWISLSDGNVNSTVEGAVKQDNFGVRNEGKSHEAADEERHSVSAIDLFRFFNQSIDQVTRLEWDNDFQYAKFMTALSKSMGTGLHRYCELLEQTFIKEMDRMTPAQEAALAQTRQEKWMQMAKDAITAKEKVEPFHFLPESFVKLNNVEYAMLQLDKIEKEMNVDACVDVIKRNEPPQQDKRRRRNEKFVFTIKIIEAEDLKACDPNGLSDPYVVLGDEFQKRLAKTRIIYANLNPRWDETVDITATGLLSVTATIWDWDVMGDHDCVGRTTIKLDPSHFSDYMPREYWLDLDTQGRLLVRITMEGEKDDIQFYFGKAFRGLKRTERDMTRKITDKLSAYIHHCLSKRALKSLTRQNNISLSTVSTYFQKRTLPQPTVQVSPTSADVATALQPLFDYLNENLAIMKQTLTSTSMIAVMTRIWKEVLSTIESLLVPPLSDKPSPQQQLQEPELETVFKWLTMLFDFFHAFDDETGQAYGVPLDVLKSPKYHDLQNLNFFYYETTDTLIRTSERMATATADRQRNNNASNSQTQPGAPSTSSASAALTASKSSSLRAAPTGARRSKTVLHSRNLGTMRKAKEDKRKEAQAEPSDDMILRILRMRPEAARYLRDRARQRERLAAAAAADFIVRQSVAQGERRRQGMGRNAPSGGVPSRRSVMM